MTTTTLYDLMQIMSFDNILELKRMLIHFKKLGFIFIKEDISGLDHEDEFECYLAESNEDICEYPNAFPVPINEYYKYKSSKYSIEYLFPYYLDYYNTCQVPSCYLSELSIYKAKLFVWFYHS